MSISPERLKAIEAIRDEDIDYSDIPATDAAFWADADLRLPTSHQGIYIHLEPDILAWLKQQGPDYQTRINTILRAYMVAQQAKP
ncbi:BrnA antitoxin family protein [Candidatus Entotheonella palauensis]|uniref:3-oxoacyl-ACP synthase n=1 Tax=Candidatus Entotheonella gemina TaxID=1429439 RepID=W4L3X3_9BACT|nr:BrnA antitoxin family protein [Candidatus Entotheonella palauensis]ETW92360.1 MAG: hypothetical protein ETSY2_53650 [Candidatus Entotheonella gemina]